MSEFSVMTMEQIEAVAAKHNCSVVVAKDNELQLDYDQLGDMRRFHEFYEQRLCKRFNTGSLSYVEWTSKSGNRHVVVTLPVELPIVERIAIQAMAGSDPIREWAAMNCHYAGSQHPILLFKPNY